MSSATPLVPAQGMAVGALPVGPPDIQASRGRPRPAADPAQWVADVMAPFSQAEEKPWLNRAAKFSVVLLVHLALLAWINQSAPDIAEHTEPIRLDVRTLEIPSAAPARPLPIVAPKPTVPAPAKPAVQPRQSRPAPQALRQALPTAQASTTAFSVPPVAAPEVEQGDERRAATVKPDNATGGVVSAARYDADYLKNPAPDYPAMSRRMREQGTVQLDVKVLPDGRAAEVKLHRSSGYARLDEAALETVRRWRFVPARKGSEAIAADVIVPIEFKLGG